MAEKRNYVLPSRAGELLSAHCCSSILFGISRSHAHTAPKLSDAGCRADSIGGHSISKREKIGSRVLPPTMFAYEWASPFHAQLKAWLGAAELGAWHSWGGHEFCGIVGYPSGIPIPLSLCVLLELCTHAALSGWLSCRAESTLSWA